MNILVLGSAILNKQIDKEIEEMKREDKMGPDYSDHKKLKKKSKSLKQMSGEEYEEYLKQGGN